MSKLNEVSSPTIFSHILSLQQMQISFCNVADNNNAALVLDHDDETKD